MTSGMKKSLGELPIKEVSDVGMRLTRIVFVICGAFHPPLTPPVKGGG